MLKTRALLGFILLVAIFVGCKQDAPYDDEAQLAVDDSIIVKYMADSNVKATKHSSGLYYNIIKPGAGNETYADRDTVYGRYKLKLLMDSVLRDKNLDTNFRFLLPGNIEGWQIGTRLIQPGGAIRLIIPSALGYKNRTVTSPLIPANSILDITLEIDKIKHSK